MAEYGPQHLGGGVWEKPPDNAIPEPCASEVLNVEFTEGGPATRLDFQEEDASGPGTAPYAAAGRFETTAGVAYKVVVDANGDIYYDNEAGGSWTQLNYFAGKGEINSISTTTVTLHTTATAAANPEKWGYGIGIMAQPGDGFKRDDDSTYEALASAADNVITLSASWAGSGTSADYTIRRRLSIAATRRVRMTVRQGLLIFTDEASRPLFWDGTTFGELTCFLNPRDDTVSIADTTVSGVLESGIYHYRTIFLSATGAFCPASPELIIGAEYFQKTVGANKQAVLTKKIYAQGFPSWVTKVALFRTQKDPANITPYVCGRAVEAFQSCQWAGTVSWLGLLVAGNVQVCKQPSTDTCDDKREAPFAPYFFVAEYDLDGTAIQDNVTEYTIMQNEMWQEYGSDKHVDVYTPANWTDLPTYAAGLGALVPFKGRLFGIIDEELRYSGRPKMYSQTGGADEPGWWFAQNARIVGRDDGQKARAIFTFAGDLYVAKDHSLMRLDTRSPDPANWVLVPMTEKAGAFCQEAVVVGTRKVLMLCVAEGQVRLYAFNGMDCRDVSDPLRTTLDSLSLSTDTHRTGVDSVIWKDHVILNAIYSTSRKQIVLNMKTGAWTVWDAAVKYFFDGLKSNTYLFCLRTTSETKLQRFLATAGTITSRWTSKAYSMTEGHVWKMFRGLWMEVESDSGLLVSSAGSELYIGVAVDGTTYSQIMPTVGTLISTGTRQQLYFGLPTQKAGDDIKLKLQVSIAADFQLHKVVWDYEPLKDRRTRQ